MTKLSTKYTWRELSSDGTLVKIYRYSTYYRNETFDDLYDSEYEAIKAFEDFMRDSNYVSYDYVLVKVYGKIDKIDFT